MQSTNEKTGESKISPFLKPGIYYLRVYDLLLNYIFFYYEIHFFIFYFFVRHVTFINFDIRNSYFILFLYYNIFKNQHEIDLFIVLSV